MKSKRGCFISLWHALFFFFMFFALEAFFMGDFFHRMTRNLFGDFLLRRLLTDFRGCDLFGRCRYPLRVEYVPQISQINTDFSCFNFIPFLLISHFLVFLLSHLLVISHFSFLIFFSCQKIEKNKQNIKRNLHYFFYFCREILNL